MSLSHWRTDELGLVSQPHRGDLGADDIFAPPVSCPRVISPGSPGCEAHALDHDKPPRAEAKHVVADALGGLVPIAGETLAPRAGVRLILQICSKDVPMTAQVPRNLAPRFYDPLLRKVERLVVPQALPWPRILVDTVARNHHQNAAPSGLTREHAEHLHVARLKQQRARCSCALRSFNNVIFHDILMIEPEIDDGRRVSGTRHQCVKGVDARTGDGLR